MKLFPLTQAELFPDWEGGSPQATQQSPLLPASPGCLMSCPKGSRSFLTCGMRVPKNLVVSRNLDSCGICSTGRRKKDIRDYVLDWEWANSVRAARD